MEGCVPGYGLWIRFDPVSKVWLTILAVDLALLAFCELSKIAQRLKRSEPRDRKGR